MGGVVARLDFLRARCVFHNPEGIPLNSRGERLYATPTVGASSSPDPEGVKGGASAIHFAPYRVDVDYPLVRGSRAKPLAPGY